MQHLDDSVEILDILSQPILARVELKKLENQYKAGLKVIEEKINKSLKNFIKINKTIISYQSENMKKIEGYVLSTLPKYINNTNEVSAGLKEMKEKLESNKIKQKDLIKKNNGLQELLSGTQKAFKEYVVYTNQIASLSDQEKKYSQALEQVKDFN